MLCDRRIFPALLALSLGLSLYLSGCTLSSPMSPGETEEDSATSERPLVIVYVNEHCKYCSMARSFLERRGISYEARDVIKSVRYRRQFESLGGDGTPLFVIGSHIVRGFDQRRVLELTEAEAARREKVRDQEPPLKSL